MSKSCALSYITYGTSLGSVAISIYPAVSKSCAFCFVTYRTSFGCVAISIYPAVSKCFAFCCVTYGTSLGSRASSIYPAVSLGCIRNYNCIGCVTIVTFCSFCAVFCASCVIVRNIICEAVSVCRICSCYCLCFVTILVVTNSCFCAVFCTSCIIVIVVICELVSWCGIIMCCNFGFTTNITFYGFPSIFCASSIVIDIINIFVVRVFSTCFMIESVYNATNQIFEFFFCFITIVVYIFCIIKC